MAKDVIITPASGLVDFQSDNVSQAHIELDNTNNLVIAPDAGNLIIGDGTSDLYIGDGSSSVDIVFQQNGSIKGLGTETITLGSTGDTILFGSNVNYGAVTTVFGANSVTSFAAGAKLTVKDPALAAQWTLSGGGNVVWNGSRIKWDVRIILIPIEKTELGSAGHFSINCPTSGTVTYYNSGNTITTVTCDANGVPIGQWEALYYKVVRGANESSVQANFIVANYQNSLWEPDSDWILICVRNGDDNTIKWIPGQVNIPSGGTYYSSTAINSQVPHLSASVVIRGSGNNNPVNRYVALNNTELVNNSSRGLTLTIINGANLTHVSSTNYDTYGSTAAVDSLATAITGLTSSQIGILTSLDAWDNLTYINNNLRSAAIKVGLTQLATTVSALGNRKPYAAIFKGTSDDANASSKNVIERMESSDADAARAVISTYITTDGVTPSIAGTINVNALYSSDADREDPIVVVDSSGNMGVGTLTPSVKLDVAGEASITSASANPTLILTDTAANSDPYIRFVPATTSNAFAIGIDDSDSDKFKISYGSNAALGIADRLTIDVAGNVGIGTTSPVGTLEVLKTNTTAGQRTTPIDVLYINAQYEGGDGLPYLGFGGGLIFRNETYNNGTRNSASIYGIINDLSGGNNNGGSLQFRTANTNSVEPTTKMTLTYDGLLGIATTSPSQRLSVAGNALIGTEGNTRVLIQGAGGTQAIAEYFSTESNVRWAIGRDLIAGGQSGIGFGDNTNTITVGGSAIGIPATRTLAFYTSNATALTERMRISSNGDVGIGTTTPANRLHLYANNTAADALLKLQSTNYPSLDLIVDNTTSTARNWRIAGVYNSYGLFEILSSTTQGGSPTTSRLAIDGANGNVGIGTTSPLTKLYVETNVNTPSGIWCQNNSTGNNASSTITAANNNGDGLEMRSFGSNHSSNPNTCWLVTTTGITNGLIVGSASISLRTNSLERLKIENGGNIGINTASPGSALDVKGTLRLSGATSGYVGFAPAAAAGSTTYTLPSADGSNGQVLTTNGSGTLSWSTASGASGYSVSSVSTTTNVSATSGEIVYLVNAASGSVTMNLPTAVGNTAKITIKKTDSSANTVVVDANSTQTIDGSLTKIIEFQYTSITLISDNANWFII